MLGGIVKINLVGTDTETADHNEVLSLAKDIRGELRLRTDTDSMDITIWRQLWSASSLKMASTLQAAMTTQTTQQGSKNLVSLLATWGLKFLELLS